MTFFEWSMRLTFGIMATIIFPYTKNRRIDHPAHIYFLIFFEHTIYKNLIFDYTKPYACRPFKAFEKISFFEWSNANQLWYNGD